MINKNTMDLKNLHSGIKLIKQIVQKSDHHKQPWSRENQRQKVAKHKNIKPKQK